MRSSDLVFFLTGVAALVYETVWIRLLSRLLGSDAGALAIVLATFMGGMGLGAALFADPVRRVRRPAVAFAAIELGLALWAGASPALFGLLTPVEGGVARALVAALVLLPPTLAMGATFPLMGRITIAADSQTARATSAFYGANTLGAAVGALLGPFVLMPAFGLTRALIAAAVLDVAAAVAAWRWLTAPEPGSARGPEPAPAARGAWLDPFVVGAFLLGTFGLGLEVIGARLLVNVTGASVYAYAIVLGVFLFGIGLGSRQVASAKRASEAPGRTFVAAALALAPLTLLGLWLLRMQLGEADLFGSLANRMPRATGIATLWASHALLAALALLPPAFALGAALPAAAASVVQRHPQLARERALGVTYAANTAGALVGSLIAAFVLLPHLGARAGVGVLLALPLAAAAIAPARLGRLAGIALAATLALALLVLPPRQAGPGVTVVLQLHGVNASVAVEDAREPDGVPVRSLRVNGKVVATTAPVDLRLQRLLGHVPGLLHGGIRNALVIGLGTGMTAGALLDFESLERLEICELTGAVRDGARAFAEWNGAVVDDPRTVLRIADGRHALASSEERYDLITSDPIHPWTRGSSDLYSLEHFREMAAHLAPGGVASQWMPLYEVSSADVRTVVAGWCEAFPHTSAWLTGYDLALVGSNGPPPNEGRLHELELPDAVARHLAQAGVHSALEISALQVADDAALRAFAGDVEPMRDDRPTLEFRAPRSFLSGYSVEVLRWAGRPAFIESLPAAAQPRARELRALLDDFLAAIPDGLSVAANAYGRALVSLPPAEPPP